MFTVLAALLQHVSVHIFANWHLTTTVQLMLIRLAIAVQVFSHPAKYWRESNCVQMMVMVREVRR